MKTGAKHFLKKYDLKDILKPHVGEVLSITPLLPAGKIDTVFKIETAQKNYALKIGGVAGQKMLWHEAGSLENEFNMVEAVKFHTKNLVARPIYKDFSCEKIDAPFMVSEYINASPASLQKLAKAERGEIMFALGAEVARLHGIKTGASFGFTHKNPHPGWRDFFTVLFNKIVDDAVKFKAKIPDMRETVTYINKNMPELEAVEEPFLAHCDLNPVNALVDANKRFAGLIDFKSAFYGDFCADFASLTGGIEANPEFLEGYQNVRHLEITENLKIRIKMLSLYYDIVARVRRKI